MFRLERIELLNWDIQENQILVLRDGVNLLTGENGSGKTAILDAIKVALGASHIGADRSIDFYLRGRDAPVAMVRLVASNLPDPATRVRPFDALGGGFESDRVSLAVVASATDDGYARRWYILDGDTSPLARGVTARPFERLSDYTDRLDRLGLGRSFRRLICTPQHEVASLCRRSPSEVFDLLYDIIGGKDALEEWERLKRDYEATRREFEARGVELEERRKRHDGLRARLENHLRYLRVRQRLEAYDLALPLARSRVLLARHQAFQDRAAAMDSEAAEADRRAREKREQRVQATLKWEETSRGATEIEEQRAAKAEEDRQVGDAWAAAKVELDTLERLRKTAESLPVRDLDALQGAAEDARAEAGRKDARIRDLANRARNLESELESVERGSLPPPEAVRRFQEALRLEGVTEHMLMADLLDADALDETDRVAIESFLGDLRFAIAVPDVTAFARVVAVARRERFPYYVLAPDVRARRPGTGEHPFLDAVRVKDPGYEGLVTRLLRWVRRLPADEAVGDTFREPGARVAADGFVLDRMGGVYRGTGDFFLGRAALEERKRKIHEELAAIAFQTGELTRERDAQSARARSLEREAAEERTRREWESKRADHARLVAEVQALEKQRAGIQKDARALDDRWKAVLNERGHLAAAMDELDRNADADATRAAAHRGEGEKARAEAERIAADVAEAVRRADRIREDLAAGDASFASSVEAMGREKAPEVIEDLIRGDQGEVQTYSEIDRDESLPGNVRTLERQVEDVREELARLEEQAEADLAKVEAAHDQYRRFTRKRFKVYFDRLRAEAERIRFRVDGNLTERTNGRFDVALMVGVGDKAPVPYDSPALSGGEKAALSILMAMSAIEGRDGGGPGFFVVDEPFSASDTHKIRELGTFLAATGAQYLISMPTTMDIARCGSWLQAVLTCTKTLGGDQARLAPVVKCSYVERSDA